MRRPAAQSAPAGPVSILRPLPESRGVGACEPRLPDRRRPLAARTPLHRSASSPARAIRPAASAATTSGAGRSPAIAVPGGDQGPARPCGVDEARDSTTSGCHDAARPAGRPAPGDAARSSSRLAVELDVAGQQRARCSPARICSTQERSLSRRGECRSGMQPLEVDAVPGPACAARAADHAGRRRAPRRLPRARAPGSSR